VELRSLSKTHKAKLKDLIVLAKEGLQTPGTRYSLQYPLVRSEDSADRRLGQPGGFEIKILENKTCYAKYLSLKYIVVVCHEVDDWL
jgi:hypothetical protein